MSEGDVTALKLFPSSDLRAERRHGSEKGSRNDFLAEVGSFRFHTYSHKSHALKRQAAQSRHHLRAGAKLVWVKSRREQKRTRENKQKSR